MFKKIGERSGKMRISLLPIGAYKPNWFMAPVHTSPEEAVKAHLDVQSEKSFGIHFGTFPLGDEGQDDPVTDLKRACAKYNLNEDQFTALKEGEVYIHE
jgi:L-ascorbate metabolism protein UlaG (beta-lactamase superfamily)